uniref:Secreted protein n=1 Tax=Heterorhabditis bacteriophora TaxID=37862 RepID=A0A1I7W7U4_HETBA
MRLFPAFNTYFYNLLILRIGEIVDKAVSFIVTNLAFTIVKDKMCMPDLLGFIVSAFHNLFLRNLKTKSTKITLMDSAHIIHRIQLMEIIV